MYKNVLFMLNVHLKVLSKNIPSTQTAPLSICTSLKKVGRFVFWVFFSCSFSHDFPSDDSYEKGHQGR